MGSDLGYGEHLKGCERGRVVELMDNNFPLTSGEREALLGPKLPVGLICNCFAVKTGIIRRAPDWDMAIAGVQFVEQARRKGGVEHRLEAILFQVRRGDQLKKPKTRAEGRVRGKPGEVIRVDFGSRRRLD